jgi:uncharacterized protein (TIGR02302 family)
MTVKMTQGRANGEKGRREPPGPAAVFLARAALFLERLAPIATLAAAPIALIVVASLFDVWISTPQWAHAAALLAAVGLSAALGWRRRRGDLWPTRREGLARLEKDGGVRHDALLALEDRPAAGAGPLWDAHVAAMREKALAARLLPPRMTANAVDPYGLRYAALAALAVGWIAAGSEAGPRLLAGFIPSDPAAARAGYADLWIEPPVYTGKAPIYLLHTSDSLPGARKEIEAPEGSVVRAQVNARSRFRLALKSGRETLVGAREGGARSARVSLVLSTGGMLTLRAGGREGRWPVRVIEDSAPTIEFAEPPKADANGRLLLSARIDDDYGVVSASLRMRLDASQERPLDAPAFSKDATDEERLSPVDGLAGPSGARSVAVDLEADPWAGLKVVATLVVVDAAGQSGESAPASVTLLRREFFNPLARSVIEQRQSLAVAANEWRRAEWAFNGMTLGPEYFFDRPTDYLLLRTAMWRINKEAGGDYKETVADFWPLALQLEDEALELARRRLEAAKEALKEALENGASDSEIERLTEEMRAALQHYLQALEQSGDAPEDGPPPDEIITSADLDAMLDDVRDLAKSGAEQAARQALSDLEALLDNLRPPRRAQRGGESEGGQSGGPAGEAGDLIGRQRDLSDKSFERGQTRGAVGDDLGEEQSGIAGDLSEFMKSLEGGKADPSGAAARALQRALGDMRRSEEALKGEDFNAANDAMERAIANLREGAGELARAEGADGKARATRNGAGRQPMRDPLGRPAGEAYGQDVDIPDKSDAQKARELLDELRRRLSDGERDDDEIKYLERLLERF